LIDFLTARQIACQTDNLATRMLLWPHPLIPDAGFIPAEHDDALMQQAYRTLGLLDHVNIVENPALAAEISAWLGRPFSLTRDNATRPVPPRFRIRLADELTRDTMRAWHLRTRLDFKLWSSACERVMPRSDPASFAMSIRQRALAHHDTLLSAGP
jgi:Arc/MetJ family transcription regulator